ncbi:VTT domain-containing protein [Cognatilysobacter tabacisoli]|uniref:VTT domain-containing protein n=1 Tax=Cognatilysobacter tabacisoli TaxID=2315424 RepID=UPI000E6B1FD1|nr:VTT domain-containing protein [Lysobacter tabacisoli]
MSERLPAASVHWRPVLAVVLGLALLITVVSLDATHDALHRLLAAAEPVIRAHPVAGVLVFVLLSAASALLAFFSSALLVPVAVYTWGAWPTMGLLWLGWLLGGLTTYGVGRWLRRPLVHSTRAARLVDAYAERLPEHAQFPLVLLLQFALPSEVPGYLCGLLGVRFRVYFAALAVAELPYAAGTVLLGEGVVEQRAGLLVALGALALAAGLVATWLLRRRLRR